MTGTLVLTPKDSEIVVLDLRNEIVSVAASISQRQSTNLYGYAKRLSKELVGALRQVKSSGVLEEYPTGGNSFSGETGNTIARIFLDGYYHNQPGRASIRISHSDQILADPQI